MAITTGELVAHARRLEEPARGLVAVAALRRRLETIEALHVENARRLGLSWNEIATALGGTKQALHQKHAKRLLDLPQVPARPPEARGNVVVTGEARQAVYFGRQEARALGHGLVGTGHLLLGLLRPESGVAAEVVGALGVYLGAARDQVDRLVSASRAQAEARTRTGSAPVSQAARRALEQSLAEAVRLGDGYLGVEHLLLAVLREEGSVAVRALAALGISPSAIEERLEARRADVRAISE